MYPAMTLCRSVKIGNRAMGCVKRRIRTMGRMRIGKQCRSGLSTVVYPHQLRPPSLDTPVPVLIGRRAVAVNHSKTTLHPSALATTNVKSCRSSPIDSTGSSAGTVSRGNRLRICTITKLASSKAKFSTPKISRCIALHGY